MDQLTGSLRSLDITLKEQSNKRLNEIWPGPGGEAPRPTPGEIAEGLFMQYRTLGNSNLKVSEIGFGAWQIGGGDWGKQDDAEAIRSIQLASIWASTSSTPP